MLDAEAAHDVGLAVDFRPIGKIQEVKADLDLSAGEVVPLGLYLSDEFVRPDPAAQPQGIHAITEGCD